MCVPLATSCAELSCACAEVAAIIDCWVSPCGQFCAYNIPPEMQMTLAEKIHCGDEQSRLKKQAYLDQAKVEWFVPTSMKGGCMVAGTVICKALCMAYAETVMGPLAVACDTYAAPSHSQLTTRFLLGSPGSYPPLPPSGGRAGWRWRMTSVNGVVGQVVSRNGCPNLDRPAAGPFPRPWPAAATRKSPRRKRIPANQAGPRAGSRAHSLGSHLTQETRKGKTNQLQVRQAFPSSL